MLVLAGFLILKMLNVFLRLKFPSALYLNKLPGFGPALSSIGLQGSDPERIHPEVEPFSGREFLF